MRRPVALLLGTLLLTSLVSAFVIQPFYIPSGSMADTLHAGDRVFVNKLAYRMGEPRRSDIVMLYYPINPDKSFVKRVIAE